MAYLTLARVLEIWNTDVVIYTSFSLMYYRAIAIPHSTSKYTGGCYLYGQVF